MRAAIAVAAFAVAANAIAIPAADGITEGTGLAPDCATIGPAQKVPPHCQPGNGGGPNGNGGGPNGNGGGPNGNGGGPNGNGGGPNGNGGGPNGNGGGPNGNGGGPNGNGGGPNGNGGGPNGNGGGPNGNGGGPNGNGGGPNGNGGGPNGNGGGPNGNGGGPNGNGGGPNGNGGGPNGNGGGPNGNGGGPNGGHPPKHDDDDYNNYQKPDNYDKPTTYTPEYPTGGYKAPEKYPADSEYSKPHYPPPPKDCDYGKTKGYPYPDNYPAKGDYGQHDNHGNDYKPHGYKAPKDCGVYSPRHGQPVTCGKKHKFEWHGFKGKQVKLELVYGKGGDDCHHYTTISDSCDNSGHYEWDVPKDIPPTGGIYGYGLKVTCHDTGDVYYSPQFCFDNKDFYNEYKHPACPEKAPEPVVVPPCTECQAPPPPPAQTAAPVAPTPCPTDVAVPAATGNSTIPTYESGASGVKQSMSFIAALAALVVFAL